MDPGPRTLNQLITLKLAVLRLPPHSPGSLGLQPWKRILVPCRNIAFDGLVNGVLDLAVGDSFLVIFFSLIISELSARVVVVVIRNGAVIFRHEVLLVVRVPQKQVIVLSSQLSSLLLVVPFVTSTTLDQSFIFACNHISGFARLSSSNFTLLYDHR